MFLRFIQQKEIKISLSFPFFLFAIAQGHISMTTTCCPFYPTDGGETLLFIWGPPPPPRIYLYPS
jgi:hypothetical protein